MISAWIPDNYARIGAAKMGFVPEAYATVTLDSQAKTARKQSAQQPNTSTLQMALAEQLVPQAHIRIFMPELVCLAMMPVINASESHIFAVHAILLFKTLWYSTMEIAIVHAPMEHF